MSALIRRTMRVSVTGAAALGVLIAPAALISQPTGRTITHEAQPCYNGIVPGNPYVRPCNFPPRQPKVRGAAPDQAAIIACRGFPGCLSWYINNPH